MKRLERLRLRSPVPLPTSWEAREVVIRLLLLPLVAMPRVASMPCCRLLAKVLLRRRSRYGRYLVSRVPPGMPALAGGTAESVALASETLMRFETVLLLRQIVVPRWRRTVRTRGLDHVRECLSASRGAILWIHPCISSNVAVKQAMFEAGMPLAHLSRPGHPFSSAEFGRRIANPLLRRPEVRFLAERVVIDEARSVTALRRLHTLLQQGRVVSITVTDTASSISQFDFFGGQIVLPHGPLQLADATGARLIPVFTSGSPDRPVVEFGEPLAIAGRDPASLRAAHEASVAWLEARIKQDPLAWIGWRQRLFRHAPVVSA